MAENYRSLSALERTASTSRVLNLAALSVKNVGNPQHQLEPFFTAPALNAGVILKHRLRADEMDRVYLARRSATKLILPFERSELGLGGRSLFVGEAGWMDSLQEFAGVSTDLGRDARVLEALDELPSLDPFLLREHLTRRGFEISDSHFEISPVDLDKMQQFVGGEITKLIELAYKGRSGSEASVGRLVQALLSSRPDQRLEPLRLTLRLEGDSYREGIFAWKGFLYYKWLLSGLVPQLKAVLAEMLAVGVVGIFDREQMTLVGDLKVRLRRAVEAQAKAVSAYLKTYDEIFEQLTKGDAIAFREFLLESPVLLRTLGEGTGALAHIVSFWRFRFPKDKRLEADVREILDIFHDFERGLDTDADAIVSVRRPRAAA